MKYEFLKALSEMDISRLADIALRMAEKHPTTFERLLVGDPVNTTYTVPYTNEKVSFTPAQMRQFQAFGYGDKIKAIKLVREITNIGLKEAKDLVEANFNNVESHASFGR